MAVRSGCLLFVAYLIGSCRFHFSDCFNVDVSTSQVHSFGTKGSYFGYTVALHRTNNINWVLVGAPYSNEKGRHFGAVYKCSTSKPLSCTRLPADETPINTRTEKKEDQWLGGALYTGGTDQPVVACASRFMNRYAGGYLRLHGRCSVLDGRTLRFQEYWNPCNHDRLDQSNWSGVGWCQAGISITYSDVNNQKYLLTGLPGNWQGKGAIGQSYMGNLDALMKQTQRSVGDYGEFSMGYSIAWGKFSGHSNGDVVAGSPRGDNLKGKVILFKIANNLPVTRVITNEDKTMKIGSYFGAAVCAVDLNNDGWSDLLVGAPLHTGKSWDEGKVYIYMNNGQGSLNLANTISGDQKSGAKFGSSIAAVGDLNNDGYQDVVIGEPYGGVDGKGQIYVYHGWRDGLKNNYQPVQKLSTAHLQSKPFTFGHSVAGGVDVDNNGYPDLAVGGYKSDQVFLFKTRPVLLLKSKRIELNSTQVTLGSSRKRCTGRDGKMYQWYG